MMMMVMMMMVMVMVIMIMNNLNQKAPLIDALLLYSEPPPHSITKYIWSTQAVDGHIITSWISTTLTCCRLILPSLAIIIFSSCIDNDDDVYDGNYLDVDDDHVQLLIDCQCRSTNRPTRQNNPLRRAALQPDWTLHCALQTLLIQKILHCALQTLFIQKILQCALCMQGMHERLVRCTVHSRYTASFIQCTLRIGHQLHCKQIEHCTMHSAYWALQASCSLYTIGTASGAVLVESIYFTLNTALQAVFAALHCAHCTQGSSLNTEH